MKKISSFFATHYYFDCDSKQQKKRQQREWVKGGKVMFASRDDAGSPVGDSKQTSSSTAMELPSPAAATSNSQHHRLHVRTNNNNVGHHHKATTIAGSVVGNGVVGGGSVSSKSGRSFLRGPDPNEAHGYERWAYIMHAFARTPYAFAGVAFLPPLMTDLATLFAGDDGKPKPSSPRIAAIARPPIQPLSLSYNA
jgi:hypothetical protein